MNEAPFRSTGELRDWRRHVRTPRTPSIIAGLERDAAGWRPSANIPEAVVRRERESFARAAAMAKAAVLANALAAVFGEPL